MKRIELKPEWIDKTFELEAPFVGHINVKTNTIFPEDYQYYINAGYGYLFDITDEPEPTTENKVISYQGIEPVSAATTNQIVENKPKKKGRKPKQK